MSAFNKNLLSDCLRASCTVDEAVTCDGFEQRVNHLMDDRVRLSSDAAVQEHADDCSECRQVLQQYQQLELLFGGQQVDGRIDTTAAASDRSGWGMQPTLGWAKLPLTLAALVALAIFAGQYWGDQGSGDSVVSVAAVGNQSQSFPVDASVNELLMTSSELAVGDLLWDSEDPLSQLERLVVSGTELLVGEEKVAVIRDLSNVRLDLVSLESRLESLQPMLNYSGQIPALSSMQGTVCFTLGWLKRDRGADLQMEVEKAAVEIGMQQLRLREVA